MALAGLAGLAGWLAHVSYLIRRGSTTERSAAGRKGQVSGRAVGGEMGTCD